MNDDRVNGFRINRQIALAALASVVLVGCSRGSLRNAVSWIGPDRYRPLDETRTAATGDPIDAAEVAVAEDDASGESLRSRIARRLPWNRDIPPDPFLDPEAQPTNFAAHNPAGTPADRSAPLPSGDVKTVSLNREAEPMIRPQQAAASSPSAASPSAASPPAVASRAPATDADEDLDAIEKMLARMERELDGPLEGHPNAFGASRSQTDDPLSAFGAQEQPTPEDRRRKATGRTSRQAARRFDQSTVSPGDPALDLERLLAGAAAGHDQHAPSGEGLDRAIRKGYSLSEFDRMLERHQAAEPAQAMSEDAALSDHAPAAGLPGSLRELNGLSLPDSPARTEDALNAAADEFDRTLFGDQPPTTWEAAPESLAGEFRAATRAATEEGLASEDRPFNAVAATNVVMPAWASDPVTRSGSDAMADPVVTPAATTADAAVPSASAASPDLPPDPFAVPSPVWDPEPTQDNPFTLASETRSAPSPLSLPIPAGDVAPQVSREEPAMELQEDPFFEAASGSLLDDPVDSSTGEVAAVDTTPEIGVGSDGPGFSLRNGLLFIGGVIVVVLLMNPGRRSGRRAAGDGNN